MARQLQRAARAGQALLSTRVAEAACARFDARGVPDAQVRYHGRALGLLPAHTRR